MNKFLLQKYQTLGKGKEPYISEKSIIRPTFSYLGRFTISDLVFRQILEYLATQTPAIYKILKTRVENYGEGAKIYMEVTIIPEYNKYYLDLAKEEKEKYKQNTNTNNVINFILQNI